MDIFESVNMAVTTLRANKLRSSLTMLGIIIGNASVIAMVGIGQGAQNFMVGKLEAFGANRLVVFTASEDREGLAIQEQRLVLSDAEAIKNQVPAVTDVAPMISSRLSLSHGSRRLSTSVTGTTPEMTAVLNIPVAQGRFFDLSQQQRNAQVVALGADAASKLFDNENPIGKEVLINNLSFQIIGVMQAKGSFVGDNPDEFVYIPITTMANQVAGRKSAYGIPVDYIQVTAKDQSSIRAASFQITNVLTRLHGKKDFTVVASKSFLELVGQITGAMSLLLSAIAGISLLVGGIGIMNIMLVSVTERTQEIGLRKAIGATQRDILTQFLIEAVILSVMGGIIGTGIGIGGGMLVGIITPLKPSVPMAAITLAVGFSGGIGLFFGVVPARQAAKLDPIVALRSA
ncbi:ABC transporter permease [Lyngbya aestuarii]|uniref:ABC transporter permease n=1 Tax=Lyngbya aestuarii TaxID=118322 RepID=UPI00403D7D26